MARHLFTCWSEVSRQIRAALTIRLFLDFDGTLAPFRREPGAACLDQGARRALTTLARHPRVRTTILSGRRRADLVERVGIHRVQYWGLYGWERGGRRRLVRRTSAAVSGARRSLASRLRGLRGVAMEDKGLGFSVHVRNAKSEVRRLARAAVGEVLAAYRSDLQAMPGSEVVNVVPRQVLGKGPAVRQALGRDGRGTLAIYIGDDATDEPAFTVLRRRGITIRVGTSGHTGARYRLSGPDEVRAFLERLQGELA